MRKIILSGLLLAGTLGIYAQENKDLMTWYHKDFATTQVYGVNTQGAYHFLESKGLQPKTVVVGVLDSGVEIDHPGLMGNMWKNPNEIPNNGKDDDNNGYVDDIYGWNFIGGKNGDVDGDTLEVTRIVKKYKPIFEGENSATNKANQAKMADEFKMYMEAKAIFDKKSASARLQYAGIQPIIEAIPVMVKLLNGKNFNQETLKGIQPATQQEALALKIMSNFLAEASMVNKTPEEFKKAVEEEIGEYGKYIATQATQHYNLDFDPRPIVGDNYEDYSERFYGNNSYEGPDAEHGTHVAGIIAGLPQGENPQYGVAYKVAKIMTVRTVPNGDERDKDVANAIRYAVDNGAKILNMSFGKAFSPGKKYVWDAYKYAERKGVLLVHAAGNDNKDIEKNSNFPTAFYKPSDAKPFVTNLITVGASTKDTEKLRAGFSNYNAKMVDVFAPGNEIYSPVPDGKYKYLQGTSMAAPVVAGAAAVLLSYMPSLTPAQIIESLVNTVNKSSVNANIKEDATLTFEQVSRAGGVIDVKKAAEYAYNNFYGKSSVKKVKKARKIRKVNR